MSPISHRPHGSQDKLPASYKPNTAPRQPCAWPYAYEEIASHLQLEVDDLQSEGYSESEANRHARTTFNNPALVQERFRLRNRIQWLDNLIRDLHFAFRQLRRSPGFALTAILTLALGLGANTAIFSLLNSLLLRPLPV